MTPATVSVMEQMIHGNTNDSMKWIDIQVVIPWNAAVWKQLGNAVAIAMKTYNIYVVLMLSQYCFSSLTSFPPLA